MGNPGDRVRFWTPQTGMTPQQGVIHAQPESHVYLCERAVWGYELVKQ